MKTVAIGDIHGCYNELWQLMSQIEKHVPDEKKYVFLGDYIDRGLNSKEVIDYLMSIDDGKHVFLRGNHEDMALGHGFSNYTMWISNGGDKTLASYSDKKISKEHEDWLNQTKLYHKDNQRTYVHAGFYRTDAEGNLWPIEHQKPNVLTWIREEFLYDERMDGGYVVHGHTPGPDVDLKPNRCNLDTGCVFGYRYGITGGVLSAAVFDETKVEPLFILNHYGRQ